jgi:hypothetical protein
LAERMWLHSDFVFVSLVLNLTFLSSFL